MDTGQRNNKFSQNDDVTATGYIVGSGYLQRGTKQFCGCVALRRVKEIKNIVKKCQKSYK